ncbi:MAG: SAM-dependent methyltransferase [Pyrinomonadaceae bacterium]
MLRNIEKFIDELNRSLAEGTFVKMTLGNYKGAGDQLQKVQIRLLKTKKGLRLFFLYRGATRDTAKNYSFDEGVSLIRDLCGKDFFAGHLFTTKADLQLDVGLKGAARLHSARPRFTAVTIEAHDREKTTWIDPDAYYLRALGITTENGKIRDKQHDKWRQINKFIEILSGLVEKSALNGQPELSIVDMGSGKGYLTFAAYDHFRNTRGLNVSVTGIESRRDLVDLCGEIAEAGEFEGLRFVEGSITHSNLDSIDILIALHACNTATDDAIFKGIKAGAEIIVTAPCCHQEIRPQITPKTVMHDILKHGVMLERTAEIVTDAMRSLLLERSGYSVKMLEFVPLEHTPKNNMIIATRSHKPVNSLRYEEQIMYLKEFYEINEHRLERLLNESRLDDLAWKG